MNTGPRVRVGIVGAGWWATTAHLPALARDQRVELIGIADLDLTRAKLTAERFGAGLATDSFEQLLDAQPEGVIIATPHDQHYEPARRALLRDMDVLVEKPMTIEDADARDLVALSRARGRRLDVGYPFLYTRHARTLAESIATGELGDVVTATALFATGMLPFYVGAVETSKETKPETMWSTNESTWASAAHGGGQMLSQLTHAASLLLHLTGMRPATLFGAMDNHGLDVDVWDLVAFATRDGAIGSLVSTGVMSAAAKRVEEYRIFGTVGHALLNTSEGTLVVNRDGSGKREQPPLGEDEIYPLYAPAKRFVDGILDRELSDTADLGLLTVEVLAAARTSAETGAVVALADRPVPA